MGMNNRLLRPRQSGFSPRSISGLALWLDAADSQTLYTTDAGPVTAVSSPLDISGCVGWYDSSDLSAMRQNSDGTGAVIAGDPVGWWRDKSATGANVTASGTARPTLSATGFNGRQSLVFNGTSSSLASAAGYTAQNSLTGLTRIVVFSSANQVGWVSRVFDGGGNGLVMNGGFRIHADNNNFSIFIPAGSTGSAMPAGIYSALYANSAASLRQNGVGVVVNTTTGTIPATTAAGSPTLHIGSNIGANQFLSGPIAEYIIFNRDLTPAELARVEAYLAAKWGIAGVHTPATATNDPVGAWLDKSGNNRHATQATAAGRPVIGTLGSRTAASFANANSVTVPAYPAKATSTYIYVARSDDSADTIFQTGVTNGFHSHLIETQAKFRRQETGANGVVLGSNIGAGLASLWCVDYSNAAVEVRYNGARVGATTTASTSPISDSSQTTTLGRLAPTEAYAALSGRIAEFLVYGGRNLTDAEKSRLERYLATKWGITLAPQVSNADAQDWVNRVYANGGTVSATTASAVNTFCDAIDTAGIRDRFYRVNLFGGNSDASLAAVRTPLYRGPSLSGTQYGNTMDTNANFVAGDYSEASGLKGNVSSKYLATGLKPADMGGALHLAASVSSDLASNEHVLGCDNFPDASFQTVNLDTVTVSSAVRSRASAAASQSPRDDTNSILTTAAYRIVVSSARTAGATTTLYRNGASAATAGGTFNTYPDFAMFVFGGNRKGTLTNPSGARLSSYSMGVEMNATQVAAYDTAILAFLTALGRPTA